MKHIFLRQHLPGASKRNFGAPHNQSGASIIVLCLLLSLVVIPMAGLFTFELNRWQFIERQLEKDCDAASLAGATRMAEADTGYSGTNGRQQQAYRQLQGIEAAWD